MTDGWAAVLLVASRAGCDRWPVLVLFVPSPTSILICLACAWSVVHRGIGRGAGPLWSCLSRVGMMRCEHSSSWSRGRSGTFVCSNTVTSMPYWIRYGTVSYQDRKLMIWLNVALSNHVNLSGLCVDQLHHVKVRQNVDCCKTE